MTGPHQPSVDMSQRFAPSAMAQVVGSPHVCAVPPMEVAAPGMICRCVCWREYVAEEVLLPILGAHGTHLGFETHLTWVLLEDSTQAAQRPAWMHPKERR